MSFKSLLNISLLFTLFVQPNIAFAKTVYVDDSASGSNNGSSWTDGYTDLQDAIADAVFGDQIWVAQGIYYPSTIAENDRDKSFELKDGVAIYGGFEGDESNLVDRDFNLFETYLSGDFNQNNALSDNSYSVIYSSAVSGSTIVDGFIITAGNASALCNGQLRQRYGGGWYNDASGAGKLSSPTIENCRFVGNEAYCAGGAFYNDGNSGGVGMPSFYKCSFESNYSENTGGAVYNNGNTGNATPSFTNCKFSSNSTNLSMVSYAGAVYNLGQSGNSNPVFTNCLFDNNSAFAGGAVYCLGQNGKSNSVFDNCTFVGNTATGNGGAIYSNAHNPGGTGEANPIITNSIFWGNTGAPFQGNIFRNNFGTITISYSLVDEADCNALYSGSGPAIVCGAGMIFDITGSLDPGFANQGSSDYQLGASSPAINAGIGGGATSLDLACLQRFQQGDIDLGAFESPFTSPLPIELLSFNATYSKGEVDLDWTTLTERNNAYFEIQRSDDAINFESIAKIEGHGNSDKPLTYSMIDENPLFGKSYYRLKQVDFGGKEDLSSLRAINIDQLEVNIFPNPVANSVNLTIKHVHKRGVYEYKVYDVLGQTLIHQDVEFEKGLNTVQIPEVSDLPPGTYFIRLSNQSTGINFSSIFEKIGL